MNMKMEEETSSDLINDISSEALATQTSASEPPPPPNEPDHENAFDKLSQDIHQMQLTGAIHTEWLQRPRGYLYKPDFKRKAQHLGAGGKKLLHNVRNLHFRLPGSSYRKRWFVLQDMYLRYYKTDQPEEDELGHIPLTSVNAILPSNVNDAPNHSLDLVCADRIYTIAAQNREDMVRWALVLSQVLQGEYQSKAAEEAALEQNDLNGSALEPRVSATPGKQCIDPRASTKCEPIVQSSSKSDVDALEQCIGDFHHVVSIQVQEVRELALVFERSLQQHFVVKGFNRRKRRLSMAGSIKEGDILVSINENDSLESLSLGEVLSTLYTSTQPLTLRFLRPSRRSALSSRQQENPIAVGWVLAQELTGVKCRVRLMRLYPTRLTLAKSSQIQPATIKMLNEEENATIEVLDLKPLLGLRPIHDLRKSATDPRNFIQGHAREYGISLQSQALVFTFYTQTREQQRKWIDLIQYQQQIAWSSIIIHPLKRIERECLDAEAPLICGDIELYNEFSHMFEKRYAVLNTSGKLIYAQVEADICDVRSSVIIRLEHVLKITLAEISSSVDEHTYEMEMFVIVPTVTQKYRRTVKFRCSTKSEMLKWAKTISSQAKQISGREFSLQISTKAGIGSNDTGRVNHKGLEQLSLCIKSFSSDCADNSEIQQNMPATKLRIGLEPSVLKGWFAMKQPHVIGLKAYHYRYLVLDGSKLWVFKYAMPNYENEDTPETSSCSNIDLSAIKDVRLSNRLDMDAYDYSFELISWTNQIYRFVCQNQGHCEIWIDRLTCSCDYFYSRTSSQQVSSRTKTKVLDTATYHGWLKHQVEARAPPKDVYGVLVNSILSFYDSPAVVEDEWKDADFAVDLSQHLENVEIEMSERGTGSRLNLRLSCEVVMEFVVSDRLQGKQWALHCCECRWLSLVKSNEGSVSNIQKWRSSQPKQTQVWKWNWLKNCYERRNLIWCNKAVQIRTCATPSRLLLSIALTECRHFDSYVSESSEFYFLSIWNDSKSRILLEFAFASKMELQEWTHMWYSVAKMLNPTIPDLPPTLKIMSSIKTDALRKAQLEQLEQDSLPHGWMYYACEANHSGVVPEDFSLRFFVLSHRWLKMYKHPVIPAEENGKDAVIYRLFTFHRTSKFTLPKHSSTNAFLPENCIVLKFAPRCFESEKDRPERFYFVPPSDEEYMKWIEKIKQLNHEIPTCSQVDPIAGTTCDVSRETISKCKRFAGYLTRVGETSSSVLYYVLTSCRLIAFQNEEAFFCEEGDVLGSFLLTEITSVGNALQGSEDLNRSLEICLSTSEKFVFEAPDTETAMEWLHYLCQYIGPNLSLEEHATTKLWSSQNVITSLSQHLHLENGASTPEQQYTRHLLQTQANLRPPNRLA